MGTIFELMYDKCELIIPMKKITRFTNLLNELFHMDVEEKMLTIGESFWLFKQKYGDQPNYDFHFLKKEDDLIMDEIYSEIGWGYSDFLNHVKTLFKKYRGTLFGWTYDDSSGEFYDFFNIINGEYLSYSFNNRPKNWSDDITKKMKGDNIIGIEYNSLKEKIKNNRISFYCDKCIKIVALDDIKNKIQSEFERIINNKGIEFSIEKIKGRVENSFMSKKYKDINKHPGYSFILRWNGPINLVLYINELSNNQAEIVDINLFSWNDTEVNCNIIIKLSKGIIEYLFDKDGEMWSYYQSYRQKTYFFKISKNRFFNYPFSGRPDGWGFLFSSKEALN
jgi:hypothetical protein